MFKTTLIAGAAVIAIAIAAAPSVAQDYSADPTYGSHTLITGFTPDPYEFNLIAGGSIDASASLGGNCAGNIADAPDFSLYFEAGSGLPLAFSADSGVDTTMVINGPNGRWYCDDDSGNGLNPSVVFQDPDSGRYDVWVGTYNSQMSDATLRISELTTY